MPNPINPHLSVHDQVEKLKPLLKKGGLSQEQAEKIVSYMERENPKDI